jgi:hypothetical protein
MQHEVMHRRAGAAPDAEFAELKLPKDQTGMWNGPGSAAHHQEVLRRARDKSLSHEQVRPASSPTLIPR